MFNSIEEALVDLKQGKIIIVVDDEDRENEGDFLALADLATPETINFMAKEGRGLICTPITEEIANRLDLHPMVENNTDAKQTAFTVSIDHKETTTGISAFERYYTISKIVDSKSKAQDFNRPGHVFPLIAKNGGVLSRPGHTEAAIDFARLVGVNPVAIICEIMNDDGTMARLENLVQITQRFECKLVSIEQLQEYLLGQQVSI
ncbi:3,4-dihydroxy-2-butanone-4-phosphate synthase [Bacillus sp. P1(2020)]|uniref:3,4-dihydroxy-2-butanone 4-phosphate synthase n=1 Tax=Pallidibacillus pasinlerensis TaxID=2703818 RepID=A0ABX0A149_9BACI|nr:3,4-dihydroxy-2-butanone-4-phosphate synthase [Pallidibacillus pasinlerensis]